MPRCGKRLVVYGITPRHAGTRRASDSPCAEIDVVARMLKGLHNAPFAVRLEYSVSAPRDLRAGRPSGGYPRGVAAVSFIVIMRGTRPCSASHELADLHSLNLSA
jgi:hypothetical protein